MRKTLIATFLIPLLLSPVYASDGELEGALLFEAANDRPTSVEKYLKDGARLETKDENGYTALHWAAYNGNLALVESLIAYGAQIDALSIEQTTPLMLAAAQGHTAIVSYLVLNGADEFKTSKDGFTAADFSGSNELTKVEFNKAIKLKLAMQSLATLGTFPPVGDPTKSHLRYIPLFPEVAKWVGEELLILDHKGKKYFDEFDSCSFYSPVIDPIKDAKSPDPNAGIDKMVGRLDCHSKLSGNRGIVVFATNEYLYLRINTSGEFFRVSTGKSSKLHTEWSGVVSIASLVKARRDLTKQTLWTTSRFYPKEGGFLKNYYPYKVEAVNLGGDWKRPFRLTLRDKQGKLTTSDIRYGNLNVPYVGGEYPEEYQFDNCFSLSNPRQSYNWPTDIWEAIEEGHPIIGMTGQQAELCVGKPDTINTTTTKAGSTHQWVYRKANGIALMYLYFEKGKLTTIQQ